MNNHGITGGLSLVLLATLTLSTVPGAPASASAAAANLTLIGSSLDGDAFDLDEYTDGDVTVQAANRRRTVDVDDDQDLRYFWRITPFDESVAPVRVPATGRDVQADEVDGRFVVPLPTGQPSGGYELVAGLTGGAAGAPIRQAGVLMVHAGQAQITMNDAPRLLAAAGSERRTVGRLRLEDGTPLAGRDVRADYTRGGRGGDRSPDAGLVPVPPDGTLTSTVQTQTNLGGRFRVVVSDPAEDPQGTELGGSLDATTLATPDVGDAGAAASLPVDFVRESAPAGSTITLSDLGDGRPGEVLDGWMTITAPDDSIDADPGTPGLQGDADSDPDPVDGQRFTLSLDHGHFTEGDVLPSTVGQRAGTLSDLGSTWSGITDAAGRADFRVGIARDEGFDDDGRVTSTLSAQAGDLEGQTTGEWDSANPLNGTAVDITLSPRREQPAAVAPAVAGDRTYFDVFARDQFGNPVAGEPVDLSYRGNLDDWDYSEDFVETDLDRRGDLWIVSFEAAEIEVTGTWNAPTRTYSDTAGASNRTVEDVTGTGVAGFYELDFDASTFRLRSKPRDVIEVGSAVSQVVRVLDQMGNPVRGYRVKFFRNGPDTQRSEPRARRVTNRKGEAIYTFVGPQLGKARITAAVTDGVDVRTLRNVVVFGEAVTVRLRGQGNGPRADRLTVRADRAAAGARVTLFRIDGDRRVRVGTRRLDRAGNAAFTVRDRNGRRPTAYVAVVRSTGTTAGAETPRTRVR